MRLLIIGMDRTVFKENSATQLRIARLGKKVERLEVIIFSTRAHHISDVLEIAPNTHIYPTNSYSRLLYGWDMLRIALRLPKPSVLSSQDPFEVGLVALVYATLRKVPLAVEMHTDFVSPAFVRDSLLNWLRLRIAGIVLPRADGGYAVSEHLREAVVRTYKLSKPIDVAPIYVDTKAFAETPRVKHKTFGTTLLWVGRYEKEKRPEIALRALATARAQGIDVGLVLVGQGRLEEALRKEARDLGIESFVEFAGYHNDVRPYYACADLLLVTSSYEGYGMVIVEALASGVPVLATDVGVAREAGAEITGADFDASLVAWLSGPRTQGVLQLDTYKDIDEFYQRILGCYEAIEHAA